MPTLQDAEGAWPVWRALLLLQIALPLLLGGLAGHLVVRNSGRRIRGMVGTAGALVLPLAVMVGWAVGSLRPGLWDAIWFAGLASCGVLLGGHEVVRQRGLRGGIIAVALAIAALSAVELLLPDDGRAGQELVHSDRWAEAGWPLPADTLLVPRDRWRDGQPPWPTERHGPLPNAAERGGKLAWLLHTSPAPLPARALVRRSRLARWLDRRIAALQRQFEPPISSPSTSPGPRQPPPRSGADLPHAPSPTGGR